MEFTPIKMKRLNQGRIHLGAMWVSEIRTIEGTQIQNGIIYQQLDETADKPTLTKPYHPHPNGASWRILDCMISQIATDNNQKFLPERQLRERTSNHSTIGFWPTYTIHITQKYDYAPQILDDINTRVMEQNSDSMQTNLPSSQHLSTFRFKSKNCPTINTIIVYQLQYNTRIRSHNTSLTSHGNP